MAMATMEQLLEQLHEELVQDLLNSNPTWRYVVYGGISGLSRNVNCKIVNKGIEFGYEYDCYVAGMFIFSFKNYDNFGFSSQPEYITIDYKTRIHLEKNGIILEISSYL